jgi:U-box domain
VKIRRKENRMPEYIEGGAQVLDLATAVKDGILGGPTTLLPFPSNKDSTPGKPPATNQPDLKRMMEELEASGDELEDIPSVFICPISLEPMVDPVTLCTGQTYEWAHIHRWLAMGRRTCPTTMQELWDDVVTPNSTLSCLIQTWFSQRYIRFKKRSEDVDGRASDLVSAIRSRKIKGQARVNALKEIKRIITLHPSVKRSVASTGGTTFLASLLGPFTSHAVGSEVIALLVQLQLDRESRSILMQPGKISLITDMLNEGTIETKMSCARLIQTLMEDESGFRSEIVSSPSLLVGLLRLIKDIRHLNGVFAGLTLLKSICTKRPETKESLVGLGVVPNLVDLLSANSNLSQPNLLEHALQILHEVSSTMEGRVAIKECKNAVQNLVWVIMSVSEECTRYSMNVLWAVCEMAPECAGSAVEAGLAAKLLLVIQSGCSPEAKQRSAELLKLCSLNYTTTLFISKCKLTRTIQ